jgi:hypothetical protein
MPSWRSPLDLDRGRIGARQRPIGAHDAARTFETADYALGLRLGLETKRALDVSDRRRACAEFLMSLDEAEDVPVAFREMLAPARHRQSAR